MTTVGLLAVPMRLRGLIACLLLATAVLLTLAAPQARATPVFLSAVDMSAAGHDSFEPQVVVDQAGNALVVWTGSDGTNTRIESRLRHADGTFDPAVTISDPGEDAFEPALAVDSDRERGRRLDPLPVEQDHGSGRLAPRGRELRRGPDTLRRRARARTRRRSRSTRAARRWRCGSATTAGGATSNVQASVRPAGGSFGAVQSLTIPGQYAYEPQVAAGLDADNNAAACWTRYDGAATPNLRIQCARRRNVTGFPRPKSATPIFASLVVAYNHVRQLQPGPRPAAQLRVLQPGGAQLERADGGHARRERAPAPTSAARSADGDRRGPEHRGGRGRRGHHHRHPRRAQQPRRAPTTSGGCSRPASSRSPTTQERRRDSRNRRPCSIPAEHPGRLRQRLARRSSGADCALASTVDALIPGAVVERQFAVWELGQFEVKDAGPNGTGYAVCPPTCGDGDESRLPAPGSLRPVTVICEAPGVGLEPATLRLTAECSAG